MLLTSFLGQGLLAVATTIETNDQTIQLENEAVNDQEKVNDFLKKNKLVQGQDGKLYTTTAKIIARLQLVRCLILIVNFEQETALSM
ncbi:hypothetical protein SNF32_08480 [Enterococcus mundtii]|nr:hypothetical protein [Enterococcus mundtii]